MEIVRFFFVSAAGLSIDLSVVWLGTSLLELPLWLSVALGFIFAAILTYAANECWTFNYAPRKASVQRYLSYCGTLLVALAVRISVVAILSAVFGPSKIGTVVLAAVGASFLVNYMMSRYLVFRFSRFKDDESGAA